MSQQLVSILRGRFLSRCEAVLFDCFFKKGIILFRKRLQKGQYYNENGFSTKHKVMKQSKFRTKEISPNG